MRIEILDEAEQDLIAGFRFYERQSAGLGEDWLRSGLWPVRVPGFFRITLFDRMDKILRMNKRPIP
jgi:hypothetical protein